MHAGRIELLLVVRHALVGVLRDGAQARALQRNQFVAAGFLDRFELIVLGHGGTFGFGFDYPARGLQAAPPASDALALPGLQSTRSRIV